MKKHHVELPQEALGFLFLRQAKVSGESLERLVTLTNEDLRLDAVMDGLRRLKMKLMDGDENSMNKNKHLRVAETIDEMGDDQNDEPNSNHDDEIDVIEQALADLDEDDQSQSVTEDDAREILMTLIKQQVMKPTNMSYKQVQQSKREVRNARGYRPVVSGSGSNTMRRDLQQLKAVTKCKSCGETGHWHRECPHKGQQQSQSSNSKPNANAGQSSSHSWWSIVQPADHSVQSPVGSSHDVHTDVHRSHAE